MLDLLIGPVTGLLDKFIPDADEKAKLAHEIATMSENMLSKSHSNKSKCSSWMLRATGSKVLGDP